MGDEVADTLAARVLAIGARARAAEPKRDDNRATHPEFAAFVDEFRDTFGATLIRAGEWTLPVDKRPEYGVRAIQASIEGRVWTHWGTSVDHLAGVKRRKGHD